MDKWFNADDPSSQGVLPAGLQPTEAPSWSDYAKQPVIGATGFISAAESGLSWLDDKMGNMDSAQLEALKAHDWRDTTQGIESSMTPGGQAVANGSLLDHPVRGGAMRALQMAPAIVATALPGGIVGDILGGTAGAVTAGAANAAISGASLVDQVASRVDSVPDDELRKQSPLFDGLRNSMQEQDARDAYRDHLVEGDGRLALTLLGGAVGGGFGIGGKIASGASGRALGSAVEAGLAGGAQAGASDAAYQSAMLDAGFQSHADVQEWAKQVFENMGIGAIAGGAHGLLPAHGSTRDYRKGGEDAKPGRTPTSIPDAATPDAAQGVALDAALNAKNPPENPAPPAGVASGATPTAESKPPSPEPPQAQQPPIQQAVTPAPEPKPAPEAPPTPATQSGPPSDPAVPTTPATSQVALTKLTNGEVSAVVFKPGEQIPPLPAGYNKVQVGNDLYYFNPGKMTRGQVQKAIREDTIGQALGLTTVSKDEALARQQQGETPTATVERTPAGTEVKAAAGTDQTAPTQVQQMEASKTPGNTVGVESPAQVIQARVGERVAPTTGPMSDAQRFSPTEAAAPPAPKPITPEMRQAAEEAAARINAGLPGKRVLADVSDQGIQAQQAHVAQEAAQREANVTQAVQTEKKIERAANPVGQKLSTEQIATRGKVNDAAQKIVEAHPPMPAEEGLGKNPEADKSAKQAIKFRANAIAEAWAGTKLEMPKAIRDNAKSELNYNGHTALVKQAIAIAKKKYPSKSDYEGFATNDRLARGGERQMIVEQNRAENDARYKKTSVGSGEGQKEAVEEATPESAMIAPSEHTNERYDAEPTDDDVRGSGALADTNPHEAEDRVLGREEPDEEAVSEPLVPAGSEEALAKQDADRKAQIEARRGEEIPKIGVKTAPVVTLKSRRIPVSKKAIALQVRDDWTIPYHNVEGESLPVQRTGKVGELLDGLTNPKWHNTLTNDLGNELARRLSNVIGDMDVHVVDAAEIERVYGKRLLGFYDPTHDHIVLSSELSNYGPVKESHTILHEALHGALYNAINANPRAKTHIYELMNAFRDHNVDIPTAYAYTNEHEFVSEILSNPRIRDAALQTPISRALATRLGIFGKAANLWDGVLSAVRRVLGLPPKYSSVLDGVMSVAGRLGLDGERATGDVRSATRTRLAASEGAPREIAPITHEALDHEARDPIGAASTRERLLSGVSDQVGRSLKSGASIADEAFRKYAPKFLSNDQYRQTIEHLFGPANESNDVRRLVDGIEKANVLRKKFLAPADTLASRLWQASKRYEGTDWERFAKLINDSTMHNVNPDAALDSDANAHLKLAKDNNGDESEGSMANWQARAKHPELSEAYNALPKELQELYQQSRDYFAGERNARVEQHVKAILAGHDAPTGSTKDEATQRVLSGQMTDADEEHYNQFGIGKALRTSQDMQNAQGPYFPLKRRGDYVVTGEHEVTLPSNAKRVSDNELEFPTREAAHEYVTNSDLPATAKKAYYDPETGEQTTADNISTAGSPREAYRVKVQNQHVEFADTRAQAEERRQAMIDTGVKNVRDVDKVDMNHGVDYGLRGTQLDQLEKAVRRREDLDPGEKDRLIQSLRESSIALQRGNRLEHTFLKRKNVAGASTDVIKNLTDYAHASAAFRSRAEFKPEIDGALANMRKTTNESKPGEDRMGRREAVQEYERRLEGFGSPEYQGKLAPVWTRLIQLSFIKRMLSPAHLALHLTHPMMVSAPLMAGRYGIKAYRELSRAYGDLGGRGALAEGVKGMSRNWRETSQATDFGNYFRKQLKGVSDYDNLDRMMKELEATGHIHPDAGFDVSRYDESQSSYDRGMGRVDRAFRELTSATEGVNRYATAVSAYRLALKEGMGHERAVRYAKDTVANSQGLYSQTNAAPIFRGQARPFLQFKQMPATLIHLMGKLVHESFKGETPEIRQQALRSFATMMGAATLMSGVGGLPQDAAKAVFGLGSALGVTPDWDTTESNMRVGLAHELGPEMSKLVMGGITGMGPLGVNVGHRMGYASLLTFGQPKTSRTSDVESWLFDTIMGAPGSMVADTYDGLRHLRNGEFTQAAEKLAPAKIVGDIAKAYDDYSGGKPNVGMPPTGAGASLMQAFGFEPREVQDYMDAHHAAQNQIREEPKRPRVGPKGQKILGIASKKNRGLLNDYSQSYGLNQ